ncbi:hypothetical protein [Nitrospirillum iridis]|uniref:Uncharacterized protein n=1 Tax=Nitrospirillum iridis TaxID=765888 RepID=A0A7X0AXT0_9PROT|nr:hypothetical protein [Nitrospirillum iridis]MBB6252079.1 hypothetical protein [Nitrospirillum iridis]
MTAAEPLSGNPLLDVALDAFLFAFVGVDGKGVPVTVLSALARLDLDPWQEAASLSRLPWDLAAARLASLILASPTWSFSPDEATQSAFRLAALLPRRANEPHVRGVTVLRPGHRDGGPVSSSPGLKWLLVCATVALIILQLAISTR